MAVASACGGIAVSDHEYCGYRGAGKGAKCFHSLDTTQSRSLTDAEFISLLFGNICTLDPPGHLGDTYADVQATIEKLCNYSKKCYYQIDDVLKKIKQFQDDAKTAVNNATP